MCYCSHYLFPFYCNNNHAYTRLDWTNDDKPNEKGFCFSAHFTGLCFTSLLVVSLDRVMWWCDRWWRLTKIMRWTRKTRFTDTAKQHAPCMFLSIDIYLNFEEFLLVLLLLMFGVLRKKLSDKILCVEWVMVLVLAGSKKEIFEELEFVLSFYVGRRENDTAEIKIIFCVKRITTGRPDNQSRRRRVQGKRE